MTNSPTFFSFNPRTHSGCDLEQNLNAHTLYVSIHAPTRGATGGRRRSPGFLWFQSTHPLGVRPFCTRLMRLHTKFQSTHPLGVRRYFSLSYKPKIQVSIHAPTRGATGSAKVLGDIQIVSIHAPTRGATPISRESSDDEDVSIHAPTRGATSSYLVSEVIQKVSIHAPTRGATGIRFLVSGS